MFKTDWETLNAEQKKAVTCNTRNALVLAPAGTGKTKVIAMRTAYLLAQDIPPERILCLTFTNKAAKEMAERIKRYRPQDEKKLTMKTFHAFCYYLITNEKKYTHFSFPCTILDEIDSLTLLKKVTESLPNAHAISFKTWLTFIEEVKKYSLTQPISVWYQYKKLTQNYLKAIPQKGTQKDIFAHLGPSVVAAYQEALKQTNAVDFMDLIVEAKYLLTLPEVLKKWQGRYDYIQVDEMQDTSVREYDLIKQLALGKNLALFGDFNQTIYEWRGSNPLEMTEDFKRHFNPIEIYLKENYRSTRRLLAAANDYIRNSEIYPTMSISHQKEIGDPIYLLSAATPNGEFKKIAQDIKRVGESMYGQTAILCRTNYYAQQICKMLQREDIPCLQIEDIKLFRKKEIKDFLAILQFMTNSRNSYALEQILTHPIFNLPEWLLQALKKGRTCAMYLHDWFLAEHRDPYASLFEAYRQNEIVVLDVETTGLDTTQDDIVQIAAICMGKDGVRRQLDVLVKPTKKVGASYYVHGFTDEQLEKEGLEAKEALKLLKDFIYDKVLIGHNIKYDLEIIASMLTRLQQEPCTYRAVYDTLDLAQKLFPTLENHKLETLAKILEVPTAPNHNALQDILATGEVLEHFIHILDDLTAERMNLIEQFYPYVLPYKKQLDRLLKSLHQQSFCAILPYLMNHWQYKIYYNQEEIGYLRQLYRILKQFEESCFGTEENIRRFLVFTALNASELEQTPFYQGKVTVMTVHQAKGLEFERVYLAGCNDKIFPSQRSMQEGYLAEEKRLFYVAMTRAKKTLYLTYNTENKRSMFIEEIGEDFKQFLF